MPEIRLQALGIWLQENQKLAPKSVVAALEREGRYVLLRRNEASGLRPQAAGVRLPENGYAGLVPEA